MNKVLLIIFLLMLWGCAGTSNNDSDLKRRNLSEYFVGSGVVQYFLPELPAWANFSEEASCRRDFSPRFIDLKKMHDSFSLSYEQLVQFQYSYNRQLQKLKNDFNKSSLLLKDEERLFYRVSDQIQGNIYSFVKPKFKRIHLVWVDNAVSDAQFLARLKKLMKAESTGLGHPVFVSECMSYEALKNFTEENKLAPESIKYIPFEMFSPYGPDFNLQTFFSVNIDKIFGENYEKHFYVPKNKKINNIVGDFVIHYY